jgi:hypothetical protein
VAYSLLQIQRLIYSTFDVTSTPHSPNGTTGSG